VIYLMAKISVIVPVYNVEPYLRRCVDSILAQTYRDFELVLVDDGSPDRCGEICDAYASTDARVRVIHQKNGGLSAARNAGIDWVFAGSLSEFLTFIDSDDWVAENYLEELLKGSELTKSIACVGSQEFDDNHCESANAISCWDIMSPHAYWLQAKFQVTAWGKLYPKECFGLVRYPEGRIHEDMYVTHRLLFLYGRIAVNTAQLYHYYRRAGSITGCGLTEKTLDVIPAVQDQVLFFKSIGDLQLANISVSSLQSWYAKAILELNHYEFRAELRKLLSGRKIRSLVWTDEGLASYPLRVNILRKAWRIASWFYHILTGQGSCA